MLQDPQTGISSNLASAGMLLILVVRMPFAEDVILGILHALLPKSPRQAYQAQVVHRAWVSLKSSEPRARSESRGSKADREAEHTHQKHLHGDAWSRQPLAEAGVPKPAVPRAVGPH